MHDLRSAQEFFSSDGLQKTLGVKIVAASDDYAFCRLEIMPRHLNAAGIVHGGVIFSLADCAFSVAANSDEQTTLTVTSSVSFLKKVSSGTLLAEARLEKTEGDRRFYKVEVTCTDGSKVALVEIEGKSKKI